MDRDFLLPVEWRVVGDAAWAWKLIYARVPMGILPEYLSAFADTGDNLTLNAQAQNERERLARQAPGLIRRLKKAVILHYRLRKLFSGAYSLKPFDYQIYTQAKPVARSTFRVLRPSQRWTGRVI